ncbi:hypothetical protein [Legionella jamestowniensis]|uniref:Uncharacterized protein n=1 Tax=Legionella jamestowniensis TaxID=455 RepID=A0A0W0UZG0_9GAMM|nr:hypothetical protein [Legionella jamestowniensis]KTD13262.1 hypothetical protein Ljam_0052 [Legionella jamestowniensis]SFL77931.1 hypothetical protein SAMN02746073_1876 [Legionella jamestowniensis DSM 19215]
MQERKEISSASHPAFTHTVTFYEFKSETPWTHTAVSAGSYHYLSAHPITHVEPPVPNIFHDPDDSATKVLELWSNIVRPMVSIKMTFGKPEEELNHYDYVKTEVPVTAEQYQLAQKSIEQQIQNGKSGLQNYSIFKFLGNSCAESSQEVLETITQSTQESSLAQRGFFEHAIALPQAHFKRAQKVSQSRQDNSPSTSVVSVNKTNVFFNTTNKGERFKIDALSIEQLTYF